MSELFKSRIFDIMQDPGITNFRPTQTYASKKKFLLLVLHRLDELNLLVPEEGTEEHRESIGFAELGETEAPKDDETEQ